MAEPKQVKIIKGGLNIAKRLLDDGEQVALSARERADAGRKAAELIKSQPPTKASEALGQLMEKGVKRTTTTQADRTRVGGGNIGGASFPAISQVDPNYAGKVWGVMDEGTAARLKNLTDPETAWTTMLGSANQLKTNPLVFDKLKRGFVDSMKQGNLSDELAGKINHNLELTFGAGADIRDPKIWREANTFEKRAALADLMMGQGITPKKGGVALGGEKSGKGVIFQPTDILKRETEPYLMHTEHGGDVPTFAAGPRLFKLEKESEYRPDLHPGFPTLLKGEDLGVNMIPTPTEIYLPDWHKQFKNKNPDRKPGYYDLALGVKGEGLPSQELNDEYIRHLLREGFKDGGGVDLEAADRRLTEAVQKHMASGGSVDLEAADARLADAIAKHTGMAKGGEVGFKKLEFMADGGKLVRGIGKVGKRLMAEEQVASDAIGKAAQSAGMNAPVTANKPLTGIQDFHTSLMDSVRARAMDAQKQMDSWDYKYAPGQYVFTEHGAKNNLPPLKILEKSRHGWNIVREDPTNPLSKKVIDPATGKAQRTPYEPGYRVRRENGDDWSEFVIPESAIKGDVELARGGLLHMADAGKVVKGAVNIGKKLLESGEEAPKVDRLSMNFKDVTKRVPEVADAIEKLNRGEITRAQYNDIVKLYKPVTPYAFVPKPASRDEAVDALRGDAAKARYGAQAEYEPGARVGLRLDIPAYTGKGVWVNSIHDEKAKKVAYGPVASVKNAELSASQNESKRIALGGSKAPYAKIKGEWNPMNEEEAVAKAQEYLSHPEWKQIGFDPERHSYFYDRHTMEPITNAEEVIQIGPLVLGKNPKYGKMEDFEYADGGKIAKGALGVLKRLTSEPALSATEREVNLAKFLEPSVEKGRLYHGTGQGDISAFKQPPRKKVPSGYMWGQKGDETYNRATFLSPDPEMANHFAKRGTKLAEDDAGQYAVYPVRAQIERPFDYQNPEHRELLSRFFQNQYDEWHKANPEAKRMPDVSMKHLLDNPGINFQSIESPEMLHAIEKLGFDSFYTSEGNAKNIGVFDPKKIKSDTGNRGTYDINEPEMNKAEGGGAFKKLEFNQHFDGGGMAVDLSEGYSGKPAISKEEWELIKKNAPATYEWAKQNVKDEANQLKSVKGAKDFALRVGAQYAGALPDLVNFGLMLPDAVAGTSLASEKPWFGSEQIIEGMHKLGMLGENEFPIAETVAGVLAPAGLIKKGVKKGYQAYKGMKPEAPKKRRGGLTAMSR